MKKKFLCFALAAVLICGSAATIPAYAAGNGTSITLTKSEDDPYTGREYTASRGTATVSGITLPKGWSWLNASQKLTTEFAAAVVVQTENGIETNRVTVKVKKTGSGSSSGSSTTNTTTNKDGSTTTTTTKSDGTKVETTTAKDGAKTVVESKSTADGSTGTTTTKTDAQGNTTVKAEASVSTKAVESAQKANETVTVPIEVTATTSTKTAPVVSVSVPRSAGEVKVEIPVTKLNSGTVAVVVNADGTEEIVKTCTEGENGVVLSISGAATVKIVDNSKDFIDTVSHWSKDEVNFVASREMFNGVGNNYFGVSAPMTRGMVNTVLARLSGENTEGGKIWYAKGTAWAVANGVSDGTNPTGNVTREQLATLLYRYAGSPAVTGTLNFADASSVSGYAQSAMLWAVQNGILNGVGGNRIAPNNSAERAQVAVMLARYIKQVG